MNERALSGLGGAHDFGVDLNRLAAQIPPEAALPIVELLDSMSALLKRKAARYRAEKKFEKRYSDTVPARNDLLILAAIDRGVDKSDANRDLVPSHMTQQAFDYLWKWCWPVVARQKARERRQEALRLRSLGWLNPDIAMRIGVSERTVKTWFTKAPLRSTGIKKARRQAGPVYGSR